MTRALSTMPIRKATRYVVQARGQVVDSESFELLGERILDASAEGCLLACDRPVKKGQKVVLTFQVPSSGLWFDAEAEVVRVVRGHRVGDPGYCAGLRFQTFDRRDRLTLGVDLRELPRVTAQRSPKERLRLFALAS